MTCRPAVPGPSPNRTSTVVPVPAPLIAALPLVTDHEYDSASPSGSVALSEYGCELPSSAATGPATVPTVGAAFVPPTRTNPCAMAPTFRPASAFAVATTLSAPTVAFAVPLATVNVAGTMIGLAEQPLRLGVALQSLL